LVGNQTLFASEREAFKVDQTKKCATHYCLDFIFGMGESIEQL
jgi:hypothetical protein